MSRAMADELTTNGNGPVGDQAAVEEVQGLNDPARGVIVGEGDGVTHLGEGTLPRPRALAHRDHAELVLRGPVQRHMAASGQGVWRVGTEVPGSGIEAAHPTGSRLTPGSAAVGRPRRGTRFEWGIREDADHMGSHARRNCHGGVLHHLGRGRTGSIHVVQEPQVLHPQVVLESEADTVADASVDQQAVDLWLLEASIGDGKPDGIGREFGLGLAENATHRRHAEAGDCSDAAKRVCHGRLLCHGILAQREPD